MNKMKKIVLALSLVTTMFLTLVSIDSVVNPSNTVQASSINFPKNMRGHWKSKPSYTWEKKHINKWMAVPAIDINITAKKATWHFVGYLPKGFGFNHKKHVLKMANSQAILKGKGPFGTSNSFVRRGNKLILFYQGGGMFTLNKVK